MAGLLQPRRLRRRATPLDAPATEVCTPPIFGCASCAVSHGCPLASPSVAPGAARELPVVQPAAAPSTTGAAGAWFFVGTPNVGKSTLINTLAGSHLAVGNWSGTTLEAGEVYARLPGADRTLVDLPGTYTLLGAGGPEERAAQVLRSDVAGVIVNVIDATRLERDLALTLELAELGRPMVACVTMADAARRLGSSVDRARLERDLGIPVVVAGDGPTTRDALVRAGAAARRSALDLDYPEPVKAAAARLESTGWSRWEALAALEERGGLDVVSSDVALAVAETRHAFARALAAAALERTGEPADPSLRIDRVALHPVAGPLLLVGALALCFHLTFALANPWIDALGAVQQVLAGWIAALPLPHPVGSFLADGLVAGVGTVISFVPVMFVLYAVLGFLENAGLLARIAFLADRLMRTLGLPGQAVLPLVLASGCNVPAVQATRGLERRVDRLRVALAVPSMSCSARLPIFVLIAAAVVPAYAGLVVTGLYLLGFGAAIVTALLLGRLVRAPAAPAVMELPPYRWPSAALVLRLAWLRTAAFLRGAGGPILVAVLVVWALTATYVGGASLFDHVARALAPLFRPLGWGDARLVGALIPGAVAKEVILGSLGLTFLGADPAAPLSLVEGLRHIGQAFGGALHATATGLVGASAGGGSSAAGPLAARLGAALTLPSALSFLVFSLLYMPCVATLAAIRREFGGAWAAFSAAYQVALAYALALVTFALFRL